MVGIETLESEIKPLAERQGMSVYDVEVVAFGRPTLRVFIERNPQTPAETAAPAPKAGVTVGELESFAKILIPYLTLKDLFPREGHVEVSSPGLFRKLRHPAHFTAAVGQPISVTAKDDSGKQTVKARLVSVADDGICIDHQALPFVPFRNILRAQLEPEIKI